jgi:hypothetical protein
MACISAVQLRHCARSRSLACVSFACVRSAVSTVGGGRRRKSSPLLALITWPQPESYTAFVLYVGNVHFNYLAELCSSLDLGGLQL